MPHKRPTPARVSPAKEFRSLDTSAERGVRRRAILFERLAAAGAAEQLLCDALEVQADALPRICRPCLYALSEVLGACFGPEAYCPRGSVIDALAHASEPEAVALRPAALQASADRHDEAVEALELADALSEAAWSGQVGNAAALGYMLRHSFLRRERRLRWEEATILDPARETLSGPLSERLLTSLEGRRIAISPPFRQSRCSCGDLSLHLTPNPRKI